MVANPPYSVKGFLETLKESDRKLYSLIDTIEEKSFPNNNSIENFFIERAKQLLKSDGVAVIIVPPSILNRQRWNAGFSIITEANTNGGMRVSASASKNVRSIVVGVDENILESVQMILRMKIIMESDR